MPLSSTFDDVADVDAVPDIDTVGGGDVAPEGLYHFSTDIEASGTTRVLIETVIAAELFDTSNSFDDVADIDQVQDIDAVAAGSAQPGLATAFIEMRVSQDPVASDNFGPWERIDTGFFNHRSFQFRVRAQSFNNAVNVRVTQARVRIRAVPL